MNLTNEEMALLESSKSDVEWNAACDKIKGARGGAYPPDWWPRVMASGLANRVAERFGQDDKIRLTSYR